MSSPNLGCRVPVLLIIFNRPEETKRCIEALSVVKPATVFLAADGPRQEGDQQLCRETRAVAESISWPCEIEKNYANENLGCGVRVQTAIDWAFDKTDQLIILEDDCIASSSFFPFCEQLLSYYNDNLRVMHVSGNNFQLDSSQCQYSYYFSKYTHAWGWATWKRAWQNFDWDMSGWPDYKSKNRIREYCDDPLEQRYWTGIFDQMYKGAPDVWDYKWNFSCWRNNGVAILPSVNLVTNIGYGENATHTTGKNRFMDLPAGDIGEIFHPPEVVQNYQADKYTYDHNFGGIDRFLQNKWQSRLRRSLPPVDWVFRAARKIRNTTSQR
jgi:hypothetical protein